MSNQALTWVLEDKDLPQGPKMVMVAIANHADWPDGYCWLKTKTIAKEAACTERSVLRTVSALIRNGYIRREKRRGENGKQRANDYWILLDRPAAKWTWFKPDPRDAENYEDTQDVGGINAPSDSDAISEKPSESCGPGDSDGSHTLLDSEPPKTNLRQDDRLIGKDRRSYQARTPPPVVDEPKPKVFVIQGTPAWDAWMRHRAKEGKGKSPTTHSKEHGYRTGWYFPTLFPPSSTGPPNDGTDDQAAAEFAKYG